MSIYGTHYDDERNEMAAELTAAEERIIELEDFLHEVIAELPERHTLRTRAEAFFTGRKPESWSAQCLRYVRRDIKNYAEAIESEVKQRYAPPTVPVSDDDLPF